MKIELIFRTNDVAVRNPGKNRFYFQELPNNKILDGLYIIGDQNINRFIERRMSVDDSVEIRLCCSFSLQYPYRDIFQDKLISLVSNGKTTVDEYRTNDLERYFGVDYL